jgi:tRNA A37 threonylcarbamoyladenosine modification protein TsaB
MIDAQKNSVFLGRYSWEGSILKTITEPYLCPLTEIESALASQTHLCLGDGYLHYFPYLKESLQKKLHRHHQSSDTPHAETMGHYILKNKSLFTHTSWKHVHPLYLRASAAEEVRENRLKHQ